MIYVLMRYKEIESGRMLREMILCAIRVIHEKDGRLKLFMQDGSMVEFMEPPAEQIIEVEVLTSTGETLSNYKIA